MNETIMWNGNFWLFLAYLGPLPTLSHRGLILVLYALAHTFFLSKSLFGEPTWFYIVHPNLDPTLGVVAIGCKGFLCSISYDVVILASEPDAMLSRKHLVFIPEPAGALNTAGYVVDHKSQCSKSSFWALQTLLTILSLFVTFTTSWTLLMG